MPAVLRALLIWLVIIATESLYGAIRRLLYSPEVDFAVRQFSVLVGAITIFAVTWLFRSWIRACTARGALTIGVMWVLLTVAFELGLGRLTGVGWNRIVADYDLMHGGMMPLGLMAMALTPLAVLRLHRRGSTTGGVRP